MTCTPGDNDRDTEAIALDAVRRYVWSGFYDADEIVEIIDESILEPGEVDETWLRAEIRKAFRRKRAEEKTWPAVTDCDRLDAVLDGLWNQGILALQNAGYTQQDGLNDVTHFYHEHGGDKSGYEGYCFYHGQDLERVMETGDLYLAFGHVDGEEEPGVAIGQQIKAALESAGFTVEWNGSFKTRLLVKGIRWQNRGSRN